MENMPRLLQHRNRISLGMTIVVFALPMTLCATSLLAQDAGGPALDTQTGRLPTPNQLFMTSPYVNGIIAVLSVLALCFFLTFMFSITTRSFIPTGFVNDVTTLVINRKYEEAANLCRDNRQIFAASIVQRCVENAGKSHSAILDMIDSEGQRRADIVWNRISYLADVSNVAPMLGLLGTVWGMINAFYSMEYESISINSQVLSRNIGGAMATTLFGLIVGISSLVFYSMVKGRATHTLAEVEQVVHSISDHVKRDTPGATAQP